MDLEHGSGDADFLSAYSYIDRLMEGEMEHGGSSDSVSVPPSLNKNDLKQNSNDGKPAGKPAKSASHSNNSGKCRSMYKTMPSKLAEHLAIKFDGLPDRVNQTDLLIAYLYCVDHGDIHSYLDTVMTDTQYDIASMYKGDLTKDLVSMVNRLERKVDKQAKREDILLLATIYHLMDRMVINSIPMVNGFDPFAGPGSTEHDLVIEMLRKLEADAKRMRLKLDEPNGREISKNVGNRTMQQD